MIFWMNLTGWMKMNSFEQELMTEIKNRIIDGVKKSDFVRNNYGSAKQIPPEIVNKLWDSVDWDNVISMLKPELEKRICNSIIGNMETEVKTDIKALMSVDGVRQRLRMEVYPKLMNIVSGEPNE